MKKKSLIIVVATIIIILLSLGILFFVFKTNSATRLEDDNKILTLVEQYIKEQNSEAKIIEISNILKKDELGIIGVLVKCEENQEEKLWCVYLTQDELLQEYYYVQGAQVSNCGEIVADSQWLDDKVVVFIRGIDIPEDVKRIKIPSLDNFEASIEGETYFEIKVMSPSSYEVMQLAAASE